MPSQSSNESLESGSLRIASPWGPIRALWPAMPIWRRLDSAVVWIALYTAAVVYVVGEISVHLPDWSGVSTILNTLVLGLLLGFRMQVAYDRWWEGRRFWGQLINDSRSLCSKSAALARLSSEARANLRCLIPGFAKALKQRLRNEGSLRKIPGFENSEENPSHVPLFLYGRINAALQAEREAGRVEAMDLLILDPHVRGLMDVCGGCERIKNTPLPKSYRVLLRHGLVLYLLSTPWLVADRLMWWTIPLSALLGYFLLGVELVAEDVEEPFGSLTDDLDLVSYCEAIRASTEQAFQERTA